MRHFSVGKVELSATSTFLSTWKKCSQADARTYVSPPMYMGKAECKLACLAVFFSQRQQRVGGSRTGKVELEFTSTPLFQPRLAIFLVRWIFGFAHGDGLVFQT